MSRQAHWDGVYQTKRDKEVSWTEACPETSLELIEISETPAEAAVIDIGAGASRLPDFLIDAGFSDVTALDLSRHALTRVQNRLGPKAVNMETIVADVTAWRPTRHYALWHDRAAFHFLTRLEDQDAYIAALSAALPQGGYAVIATFAEDGPEKCSGLPVQRYSPEALAARLGAGFALSEARQAPHFTPWHAVQNFQYSLFERR